MNYLVKFLSKNGNLASDKELQVGFLDDLYLT